MILILKDYIAETRFQHLNSLRLWMHLYKCSMEAGLPPIFTWILITDYNINQYNQTA